MRLVMAAALILGVGLVADARYVQAASPMLPHANQALLLMRTLAYDRNFKERAGSDALIVVLYKQGDRESEATRTGIARELANAAAKLTVAGMAVRITDLAFDPGSTAEQLKALGAVAVYVCPQLTDVVPIISKITKRNRVLSASGMEEDVKAGLSVGLLAQATKAVLLINLTAARDEGADLDASLLRVAQVIR